MLNLNESARRVLARNNVRVTGQGSNTIIFAHGFGCDQTMWRFVSPAFEDQFRVVQFDYVGCGQSDLAAFDPKRYTNLDGYAQDLVEICDAVGLRDGIFVGHSVSAMIGLVAANRRSELFAKLVMLVPSPRYLNDPPSYVGGFETQDLEGLLSMMDHNIAGWAEHLAPLLIKSPDRPDLVEELRERFCTNDPAAAKVFARAAFFADNRSDLIKARVPSLIVQVRDDSLVPLEVGDYLSEHLPHSERIILEASGHCPHMSHPQATIEAIRTFVRKPP